MARLGETRLSGVGFFLDLKLDVVAYSFNLATLPFSTPDEIAKEKFRTNPDTI
jgi:hypothetical protein